MKDDKLFRSVALERLSSPENLDQAMRAVPAKGWIALACLFVFLAAAIVWAFLGEITRQSEGTGVLLAGSAGTCGEALAVLETDANGEPKQGMRAEVRLDSGEILGGIVVSVVYARERADDTGDIAAAKELFPAWTADEASRVVRVRLDEARPTSGAADTPCTVRVILEQFHPVRLILPD